MCLRALQVAMMVAVARDFEQQESYLTAPSIVISCRHNVFFSRVSGATQAELGQQFRRFVSCYLARGACRC